MKYQHRFSVSAPIEAVASFHGRSEAMGAITPPPIVVQMHQAPATPSLAEGDEMDFTLWLGPLPLRWLARIEDVTPTGFVDRMVRGPMQRWEHRHRFVATDQTTTEVIDEVECEPRLHPLWGPIGLGMALNLPILFAYRAWQTRRLLARERQLGSLDLVLAQAASESRTIAGLTLGAAALALVAGLGARLARKKT